MPQASEELREKMYLRFGDAIDEQGPIKFLKDAGYVLTRHFFWLPKPGVKNYDQMPENEYDCLKYLIDEWDFGGLIFNSKE